MVTQMWVRYNRAKGSLSLAKVRALDGKVMVDEATMEALFHGDNLPAHKPEDGWLITQEVAAEVLAMKGFVKCDEWED